MKNLLKFLKKLRKLKIPGKWNKILDVAHRRSSQKVEKLLQNNYDYYKNYKNKNSFKNSESSEFNNLDGSTGGDWSEVPVVNKMKFNNKLSPLRNRIKELTPILHRNRFEDGKGRFSSVKREYMENSIQKVSSISLKLIIKFINFVTILWSLK